MPSSKQYVSDIPDEETITDKGNRIGQWADNFDGHWKRLIKMDRNSNLLPANHSMKSFVTRVLYRERIMTFLPVRDATFSPPPTDE